MSHTPRITTTQNHNGECRVCRRTSSFHVEIDYGRRVTSNTYCGQHVPGAALDAWMPDGRELVGR